MAGYLGLDATLIRERNFMHPKDVPHPYPVRTSQQSPATKPCVQLDDQNCNGKAESLRTHTQTNQTKSRHAKPDEQSAKDLHGRKRDAFPEVVCGRFQFREDNADGKEPITISEGR